MPGQLPWGCSSDTLTGSRQAAPGRFRIKQNTITSAEVGRACMYMHVHEQCVKNATACFGAPKRDTRCAACKTVAKAAHCGCRAQQQADTNACDLSSLYICTASTAQHTALQVTAVGSQHRASHSQVGNPHMYNNAMRAAAAHQIELG